MRIGFYIYKFQYGGGEKMQCLLAKELYDKGYDIHFFSSDRKVLTANLPYNIHLLPEYDSLSLSTRWKLTRLLKNEIKRAGIEVFVMFYNQDFVFLANLLSHTPILSSLRTDYEFNAKNLLHKFTQWLWLRCSRGVVFQTKKVQSCASKNIREKSTVIPNPIVIDNIESLIQKNRKHKIVSVGRLSEEKGCLQLIEAFAATKESHDYTLHFYGTGPLENIIRKKLHDYNLNDRVVLEGFTSSPENEIADAEIFILNSRSEGMPNALIEAMSLELACVSTKFPSGASEELIEDGLSGVLIDFGDTKQLSNVIQQLTQDDALRRVLQHEAGKIREQLRKGKIVDMWCNYLHKCIQK